MDKDKIIELLNLDLQDEHGAIIQYLGHAYAMGEGEVACEIEAIARDEMRHLDWLAETIVDLGGQPSLNRGSMRTGGDGVPQWMHNNVLLEGDAISHYENHIQQIDDPRIKRLLERILADEKAHQGKFEHFMEKVRREGLEDIRGDRKDSVSRTMNWGVEHEYTVILQYLFHSYMARDIETKRQLEDQAINEMQHLGWLAEELAGSGGTPIIEHTVPNQATDMEQALQADILIEKEVADRYDKAISETDDKGLQDLFTRIRDNELYHLEVFNDLLKRKKR